MPTSTASTSNGRSDGLLRFTNCQALLPDGTLPADMTTYSLHVDPAVGKIIDGQSAFFDAHAAFAHTIDLEGDYLVPGFIDVQINGGYGVDFSELDEASPAQADKKYLAGLDLFATRILETGVTSFVPTIITQKSDAYRKASSLGWHCEGPFLSPHKKGAHCSSLIRTAESGVSSLEEVYGSGPSGLDMDGAVKLLTLAPEVEGILASIPALTSRGVTVSIGHTASDIDTALAAKEAGARFITHLFNAMGSFNHRDPGVIGLLGDSETDLEATLPTSHGTPRKGDPARAPARKPRPFYGLIADGFHSHPCSVRMAYSAHPAGCVLVSDAMPWMDPNKPDGVYPWRDGQEVEKQGNKVTLQGTDTLAGSVVPLSDCVTNLARYAAVPLHTAAYCASSTPAMMLGIADRKGFLRPGCDADLVVLDKRTGQVKQTWVAGKLVWSRK
ncbi:putative n-acetylglucosamine-6-phosphate deacetylase from carbohydrate esterase family CE9 [Moesziomyces antarcticus]|uniref:putative n-acetylglucosamine-6-phosphate deacetylase from carbohydrate esterase family CE9 n=1 Tax=Pseudozyma antarctica TaxID=84753 RepID=UPI0007196F64|nr:putative n-acetylglucosamine-6-phosphate deacetylase from carbohydrate esterase family CE9 [Moesziomyces antarcticus]GAK63560.1 candidate n-acetylglucosamine-6-phosphate deacetylase from carbohydrate esterase family CE9 [Moesziomyces antarcticus]